MPCRSGSEVSSHRGIGLRFLPAQRARGHARNAGGTRDPSSDRRNFLRQDEQSQKRNPKYVHYPTDEQERHQDPTAADTIAAVPKAQQQAASHVVAKAPVAHQELKRRLALGETDVLEPRPAPSQEIVSTVPSNAIRPSSTPSFG